MLKFTIEESVMSPTIQYRNRHRDIQTESLQCYEVGVRYPDFEMLEPLILEYDVDLRTLEAGDIIIRDWQYGHLKNTGYIPLRVVEPLNGMVIVVETTDGKLRRICDDGTTSKDATYHKLDKSYLLK